MAQHPPSSAAGAGPNYRPQLVELIRHTSSGLGKDVITALKKALAGEEPGSRAQKTFTLMLKNVDAARAASAPICQDTGTLIFYVDYGPDVSPFALEAQIQDAVREATLKTYLRPNTVDPVTGQNIPDNVALGSPYVHLHPRAEAGFRIRFMMKGGGCENVGAQYSLPDERIGAGRDLDGVRRCIIDCVQKAQGFGCAPGTVGVGIGGDRVSGYIESKEQLFRDLDDSNPDPKLDALEKELTVSLQGLNIGPMGFGGKTTILGVKIGKRARVPASFFVSLSYMCWAYRKGELSGGAGGFQLDGKPLKVTGGDVSASSKPLPGPAKRSVSKAPAAKKTPAKKVAAKASAPKKKVVAKKAPAKSPAKAKKGAR